MWLMLTGLMLVAATGCAGNAIHGSGGQRVQVFHGPLSIAGDDHQITIQRGSEVPKLSILGDSIHVTIEDGVEIKKVEVAGDDNEIVCPANMSFEYSEIGDGNRLIHP
jgi:hypothetical protein